VEGEPAARRTGPEVALLRVVESRCLIVLADGEDPVVARWPPRP